MAIQILLVSSHLATLIGALFTVFWIPETKGKTYAEIEAILNR